MQAIDMTNDDREPDPDHTVWRAKCVSDHRIKKHPNRKVLVKVHWFNDIPTWQDMAAIRMQQPELLVTYTFIRGLDKHPDWSWTQEHGTLHDRRTQIARAFKATTEYGPRYKFGIEVPHSIKHALFLDRKNGNNLWREAIETELLQINQYRTFRVAGGGVDLSDYTRIPYHFVFDVKFDLRRKARLVAGGNHTQPPKEDIFSGVVGMETIRMAFLIAEMNDLSVCAADIGNAFLYGTTSEKVYIRAGEEFGNQKGSFLIIDKGLYGLRSSSARFHEHLSRKLCTMGYLPTKADPDFWIKDCGSHYEYVAAYVDDVLIFSKDPMRIIDELKRDYVLKGIGVPEYYLGCDMVTMDETWSKDKVHRAISSETYIKNVISKYEDLFGGTLREFKTPMDATYHPELDVTPFLTPKESSIYRGLIGSANWVITQGRYDVHYAVNSLARFAMAPQEGHLKAVKRIFGYLKRNKGGKILIDASFRNWSEFKTDKHNWQEMYPNATEEIPTGLPPPKGPRTRVTCYVDADHAHDKVTRRSMTGILLFVNNTPIKWISKRQNTVETSTYGSEMVAGRIACELILEICYNLRAMGVHVDGPALLLGDNLSVVLNTTVPSSTLKKKHQAICYHRIRECVAAGIIRFAHVDTVDNLADCLTKPLPNDTFSALVKPTLFRLPRGRYEQDEDTPSHQIPTFHGRGEAVGGEEVHRPVAEQETISDRNL